MKYIKTYEMNTIFDIQIDDYVLIDTKKMLRNIYKGYKGLSAYDEMKAVNQFLYTINNDYNNNLVKIININDKYTTTYYEIEFFNGKTSSVTKDEIKRKLKPIEIDNYEAKIQANKFNI